MYIMNIWGGFPSPLMNFFTAVWVGGHTSSILLAVDLSVFSSIYSPSLPGTPEALTLSWTAALFCFLVASCALALLHFYFYSDLQLKMFSH